jgi:hypothetical protein
LKFLAERVFLAIRFVCKLFTAALHYMSAVFDRNSRETRYVAFVLDEEKKHLKVIMADVS